MERKTKYQEKLPDVIRACGEYLIKNAEAIAGSISGTTAFDITLHLSPGDDRAIFNPIITTDRSYIIREAMAVYYDAAYLKE